MLEILLLVVFVSSVAITFGLNSLLLFNKSNQLIINELQLFLSFMLGLVVIALFSSWLSLFFPLTFAVFWPFTIIGVLNLIIKRKLFKWEGILDIKAHKYEIALFILLCILYIQLGSLKPYSADTEIYHLQIVRWQQHYKPVPGLANLFPRYSFYSNWFHLISTFSLSPNQKNLLYLNTSISIWFSFFLIVKVALIKRETLSERRFFYILYFLLLVFLLFGWNLLRGNCRSMGNDFIVTVLILYVLLLIAESNILKPAEPVNIYLLSLLCIAIPFFKLTGLLILLILGLYITQARYPKKTYYFTALVLILFLIPFLTKNYIQSGYPLFPYTLFDFYSPDWQLPQVLAERFNKYITLSNRYIYESVPNSAWHKSSFDWMTTWLFKLAFYDKILLVCYIITLPLLFYFSGLAKHFVRKIFIYLVAFIPFFIFWFFKSPDPRFIYGFLLFNTFVLTSSLIHLHLKKNLISYGTKLILWICIITISYKISLFNGSVLKSSSTERLTFKKVKIKNTIFYVPVKSTPQDLLKCGDLPIPCLYSINPNLLMRGINLQNGFKMSRDLDTNVINNYIY